MIFIYKAPFNLELLLYQSCSKAALAVQLYMLEIGEGEGFPFMDTIIREEGRSYLWTSLNWGFGEGCVNALNYTLPRFFLTIL